MKLRLSLLSCVALLPACNPSQTPVVESEKANSSIQVSATDMSISRIETGLMDPMQITGKETPYYDIESRLQHYNVPGVSIAVSFKGEVLWNKAYGTADVEQSRPMTTETMLLAGSISKPLAALRALQLHEQGQFLLDQNINTYLSSWQLPDNQFTAVEKVTLRRILNHTAGLTVWGFPGYVKGDDVPSPVDVLDGQGNTDPVRVYKTPGESWQYSGGGYTIMQQAIEDIDKVSFAKSMQSNVLNPMKMNKSTYVNPLPAEYHAIAATGYRENGDEVSGKWPIYPEMAAAGLWTTPSQLIRYGIEVQDILESKQDGILKHSTIIEMLTPGDKDHGLGPVVKEHFFQHGGADEGFRARLIAWRDSPYAAVIMVNSDNGTIMNEIMLAIAKEYDLAGVKPTVKTLVELPVSDLYKFVGTYDAGTSGILEITLADDTLSVLVVDYEYTTQILPESASQFFDQRDGKVLNFTLVDGQAEQLEWRDISAVRKQGKEQ
ncbi:MAG: CubicO group peptidase (beta-lactamase class C family) [Paraglaciecola sp.]|jgi:CubicO group peptidase (beta-lactamase class C family)